MADPNKALQLLAAVTGTGAGTAADLGVARGKFGLQVSHTGDPTAVIVDLEGSIDGTNWFALGTWDEASVNSGDIVFITDKPVTQIRGNLTTLTGGTTPPVSAWAAPV